MTLIRIHMYNHEHRHAHMPSSSYQQYEQLENEGKQAKSDFIPCFCLQEVWGSGDELVLGASPCVHFRAPLLGDIIFRRHAACCAADSGGQLGAGYEPKGYILMQLLGYKYLTIGVWDT